MLLLLGPRTFTLKITRYTHTIVEMAAQQQQHEFAGRKRIVDAIRNLANWATIQLASDFKDRGGS